MKSINRFIALGLGISITFASGCLTYGYFTDISKQNNEITFETESIKIQADLSKCEYVDYNGKEVMKFKFNLINGVKLAQGEKIKLEMTKDSDSAFNGAKLSYYFENDNTGWIEIVKEKFYNINHWPLLSTTRTIGIKASIVGLDGSERVAWSDGKSVKYFEINRKGSAFNHAWDNISIREVNGVKHNVDEEEIIDESVDTEDVVTPSTPQQESTQKQPTNTETNKETQDQVGDKSPEVNTEKPKEENIGQPNTDKVEEPSKTDKVEEVPKTDKVEEAPIVEK